MDDLQQQLSAATSELTQSKTSLRAAKQEIEALKGKHEQLVKAGVEIAQVDALPLDPGCGCCTVRSAKRQALSAGCVRNGEWAQ